jgi:hypothetical protein
MEFFIRPELRYPGNQISTWSGPNERDPCFDLYWSGFKLCRFGGAAAGTTASGALAGTPESFKGDSQT